MLNLNSAITPDNLQTKLAPSNIQATASKAVESHEKLLEKSTTDMNEMQIKYKKQYYVQTFNGDDPHMDIMDVFLNFVSYKTPDDTRQKPKGTEIDLNSVIAGILPTLKDVPEYGKCEDMNTNSMSENVLRMRFLRFMVDPSNSLPDRVNSITGGKEYLKKCLEQPDEDILLLTRLRDRKRHNNDLLSKEDVPIFKSNLEVFRLPIMDALFKFDDPELYAADKKAQAIAAAKAAASPSPSPSPTEGFSFMQQNGLENLDDWKSSPWWWWVIVVTFIAVFSFVVYMILHPYTKWCACQQQRRRGRR